METSLKQSHSLGVSSLLQSLYSKTFYFLHVAVKPKTGTLLCNLCFDITFFVQDSRDLAGRSDTIAAVRSHPSSSHQRPLSIHASSKPTSSVTPVPSNPPRATAMTPAQRLDSLIGSPRGNKNLGSPSPRSQNHTNGTALRSKSAASLQRRPVSAVVPASSEIVTHSRSATRLLPHDGVAHPRELTSTPISSRAVDIAAISPILTPSNPIRKDIPPPDAVSVPAPIRKDIPPDSSSFAAPLRRTRNYPDPNYSDNSSYQQKRPPTPKKDVASDDTDKNTQWYEYGCV